jgi:predicted amidophosphoribosyltransferase
VITTGATLESCGQELIRSGAELLIIGVIAMATSL